MSRVTKEELRNLTGLTEVEVGDSQLDRVIDEAETMIDAYTGKSWSTSDGEYAKVQTATRLLAVSLVYESLPSTAETEGKAQRYHEKAMLMLKAMRVFDAGPLKRT